MVWVVNPTPNSVKLKNGMYLIELHEVEEMGKTTEASDNVASIADTSITAVLSVALETQISLENNNIVCVFM